MGDMVTFYPQGRMGNFLFECATAYAYALRHGLEFSVPKFTNSDFHNPIYLHHLQNQNFNPNLPVTRLAEANFHYGELPFNEAWRGGNILLTGYFQSEKYFIEYRNEVLTAFGYHWEMKKGVVAVHNRRGDYLIYKEKHPYYGEDWILRAMNFFPGYRFRFFSDEISWAKEKFGHRDDCEFSEGSIEQDLIDISCCEHHINSSSTYSWWGAWLNRNPDKIIITPQQWFTPNWGGLDTKDVLPDSWIKLP